MIMKKFDVKKFLINVAVGWLMVWSGAILLWIKFDWIVAITSLLFVYGLLRIFNAAFMILFKEIEKIRPEKTMINMSD